MAGALIGLGAAARRVVRLRPRLALVAPELRSPVLHLPLDVPNEAVLGVARRIVVRPTPVAPGIACRRAVAPGADGDPAVPVVVYERPGRLRPSGALVWIHGGGLVMGSTASAHAFCSRVAAELDLLVVSVDYRLAPEHPFPAGLHDCVAALRWVHHQAEALGVDPSRIAVGGDSAGGGLAAAVAQHERDLGGAGIAFQLLVYPMLDDRTVLRAEAEDDDGFVWSRRSNRFAWTCYLGHEPSMAEERPHAAPGRCTDLAGLPSAWIGVGELDLFLLEDVDYAQRLEAAGVACELHLVPGMYHGADAILPGAASMQAFRDRMVAALATAIGSGAA